MSDIYESIKEVYVYIFYVFFCCFLSFLHLFCEMNRKKKNRGKDQIEKIYSTHTYIYTLHTIEWLRKNWYKQNKKQCDKHIRSFSYCQFYFYAVTLSKLRKTRKHIFTKIFGMVCASVCVCTRMLYAYENIFEEAFLNALLKTFDDISKLKKFTALCLCLFRSFIICLSIYQSIPLFLLLSISILSAIAFAW